MRLVNAGANLNGIHALHYVASFYEESDLFDLPIDDYGIGVDQCDEDDGRRPIHVAACTKNANAVRILISKGADMNCKNYDGQAPLLEMNEVECHRNDEEMAFLGRVEPVDTRVLLTRELSKRE